MAITCTLGGYWHGYRINFSLCPSTARIMSGKDSENPREFRLTIHMVASLDGLRLIRDEVRGDQTNPEALGIALAHKLKEQGAGEILEEIFATVRPEA